MGMSGNDIMEISALFKKMGYTIGEVTDQYDEEMAGAARQFQRDRGLRADGIAGPDTYRELQKYLLGYATHRIRRGDNLYRIAKRFRTPVERILAANPDISPLRLQTGGRIIIPYAFDVVDTNVNYTYEVLQRDIEGLAARYPFLETGVAGRSVLNRKLNYIRLGRGKNRVLYNAAHHALEWITSPVLMKFIEDFSKAYAFGGTIGGFDPRDIWQESSIYIIPMVNPDGVDLVLNGLSPENPYFDELIEWNNGSDDFSTGWQANIHGVDLNHNYDAAWEESAAAARELDITGPAPRRYPGPYPESEPETLALVRTTRRGDFRLTLAYHAQGQVIFWNFMDLADEEAKRIGEILARDSGYKLEEAVGVASTGGYKDWFIQDFRRPGYTVEVGEGENPLPISQFDEIYAHNVRLLAHAALL
jgi:g-D-glutamyl-meso-diaminopimelate peptidase